MRSGPVSSKDGGVNKRDMATTMPTRHSFFFCAHPTFAPSPAPRPHFYFSLKHHSIPLCDRTPLSSASVPEWASRAALTTNVDRCRPNAGSKDKHFSPPFYLSFFFSLCALRPRLLFFLLLLSVSAAGHSLGQRAPPKVVRSARRARAQIDSRSLFVRIRLCRWLLQRAPASSFRVDSPSLSLSCTRNTSCPFKRHTV